jgi:uncharacterized protein with ParB-like and HNH nuclease domain/predicted transport protein
MKATEATLLQFLHKSPQFVIPIYQRTYSWTDRECQQLWDDILRAGRDKLVNAHFVGSVVYIEKGLYQVSTQSPLLVIDGQQRLTTISLLLEALARHLGQAEPVDGFSPTKIRHYYLTNPLEKGDRAFKLLLTQTDKETLMALVRQNELPPGHSVRLEHSFEFFEHRVVALGSDLEDLCHGLAKLAIVDVALNRDQDNPQLIFESMNSTGRELSQADLIRNYVLMGLEQEHQTRLYNDHWRPMEINFGQEAYGSYFDSFMRHFLTVKTGEIPNVNDVYEAFKAYSRLPGVAADGVDALVREIRTFARYYCAMALGKEQDRRLADAFQDIRELRVDVAYPLLLELYSDYDGAVLDGVEFVTAVRLIEAYVFRRSICAIPTNSLNKTFATFRRSLKKDRYLESIQAAFLLLPSYRRFPNDEEFKQDMAIRDLYNFPRRSYWLRRFENYNRQEYVPVDEYTIEHIMPQNDNLSAQWQADLGPNWQLIHETKLHTLGNLTLTGYNSEYSDRPFIQKRDMPGGFKQSPLRVNEGLATVETWNEIEIDSRARRLADLATAVWAHPMVSDAILDAYKPHADVPTKSTYSIHDQQYLAAGSRSRQLFDALRTQLLALDPCVSEEFLKYYVAYKAETNFVDVVPQAGRLRMSLNMPFHELQDPRGIARDITNIGRWGNGDVEVGLASISDLPYVLGLVRQSFERQMGAAGDSPL